MSEPRVAAPRRRVRKPGVRELPDENPAFQIAPMIDVLLVLLVFFMSISSTEVLQSAKGLALPAVTGGSDSAKNNGQIVINVFWIGETGRLTVDEQSYAAPADLLPLLAQRVRVNPDTRVLVRADKNTRYKYLREILVTVGQSRISNVTFSVVNQEGPPS